MTTRIHKQSPLDPHTESEDEVSVEVTGKVLRGWKSVEVTRRMDAASGSFSMTIAPSEPWPVRAGSEVKIRFGGDLVMTGFVDELNVSGDEESLTFQISGRDRTEDLVDCAVPETPIELRNVDVGEIASHVAFPLNIVVVFFSGPDGPGRRFETWKFQDGENAYSAIERACRMLGRLAFANELGQLVVATPGFSVPRGPIVYGSAPIKRYNLAWKQADRFRVYVVHGQRPGSDAGWGAAVSEIRGEARDLQVARPRMLVKASDGLIDQQSATTYAQWLASFRAAQSTQLTLEMRGWREKPGGSLWKINTLLPITIPSLRLNNQPMLVNGIKFSYPPNEATLELVRPDAYTREPELAKKSDPLDSWGDDDEAPDDRDGE